MLITETQKQKKHLTRLVLGDGQEVFLDNDICLNYSLKPETEITEEDISRNIYTVPDCDLIIRPSGEERLSNFMLWQAAYSEFWYSDVLWPDFKVGDLHSALHEFERRNRRFGG